MREGVEILENIKNIKNQLKSTMKTDMQKKHLPRPTFGVFDLIWGSAGGPGGSPKCKKEASGEYQKKT